MTFKALEEEDFWKHTGKKRKCWKLALVLLPRMFSIVVKSRYNHLEYIEFLVCKCFQFELSRISKIGHLGSLVKNCSRNFYPSINMALVNGGFLHYI